MAVDTRAKRQSAHRVASGPLRRGLPNADGTVAQADRQHVSGYYGGILATIEALARAMAIDLATVALRTQDVATVALRTKVTSTVEWDMTEFGVEIKELVSGDDIDIERTITGVPDSDTLAKAWMTIKSLPTDADPGLLQKTITSSLTADGQITDTGANTIGVVVFLIVPADGATIGIGVKRVFDIQVKTTAGKIFTAVKGTIILEQGITETTA